EQIARILACIGRYGVEQFPDIAGLADECDARLRDREIGAAEPARHPQRLFSIAGDQPLLHARLLIGATEKLRIALERLLFDLGGELVVAPGLADQRLGAFGVALRDE